MKHIGAFNGHLEYFIVLVNFVVVWYILMSL
jgi:hypothetical protein